MVGPLLGSLARAPRLLVACDFDGTISPFASTPSEARADGGCMAALARLSVMRSTHVSVISGRPLASLRALTEQVPLALLFGSHGAEDATVNAAGTLEEHRRVSLISRELAAIAAEAPGAFVEAKPFGAALHYRMADGEAAAALRTAVQRLADANPQLRLIHGSKVAELSVRHATKGDAVRRAKELSGALRVLFAGDDLTDEDAFGALGPEDLTIKVGTGESRAALRVGAIADMANILHVLSDARERWCGATPASLPAGPPASPAA